MDNITTMKDKKNNQGALEKLAILSGHLQAKKQC